MGALVLVLLEGPTSVQSDQCYSYAGGSVYPQETTAKGHNLQWTKAMSNYCSLKNALL
jgi:hypothetical protein